MENLNVDEVEPKLCDFVKKSDWFDETVLPRICISLMLKKVYARKDEFPSISGYINSLATREENEYLIVIGYVEVTNEIEKEFPNLQTVQYDMLAFKKYLGGTEKAAQFVSQEIAYYTYYDAAEIYNAVVSLMNSTEPR